MQNLFKRYISKDTQQDIFGDNYLEVVALHNTASKQYFKLIPVALKVLLSRIASKSYHFNSSSLNDLLISIDPNQGRFLYNLILASKPKTVFEFGLSYGISALYICQALKKLDSTEKKDRQLYSTEKVTNKINEAKKNLIKLELDSYLTIIENDILQQSPKIPGDIDFLHMDGFPDINLEVFKLLESKLSDSAIIITDDVNLFKYEMRDYLEYLYNNKNYSNVKLNISDGILLTVKSLA